jgi:hypothetical protein
MRPSFRPSAPPRSDSDAPPSAGHYDQEFLYHLYRGSELLSENSVDEAKAELERALALQPRDAEGQGLLGVVYFRLGMYPMAIEIFEELERTCPGEITPKINLALCYLKTGQGENARDQLEAVVRRSPKHKRAWGYLGLVYQRFGEFEKARKAFESAGHPKLAQRMAQLISQVDADPTGPELPEIQDGPSPSLRGSMPPSLGPGRAMGDSGPRSTRSPLTAPGLPSSLAPQEAVAPTTLAPGRIALPEAIARVVRESELVFPENPRLALHPDGSVLVRIETSFAVRPQWITLLSYQRVPFSTQQLKRRSAGASPTGPLGGAAPLVSLVGAGRLVLAPRPDTRLALFNVDRDPMYVRESHLLGFQPQVTYESGQLEPGRPNEVVTKLSGAGAVVIYTRGRLASLSVTAEAPVCVRLAHVIGWTGRLLPRAIPAEEAPASLNDMVGFTGHGAVLVDMS